jgi:hypothetical protein
VAQHGFDTSAEPAIANVDLFGSTLFLLVATSNTPKWCAVPLASKSRPFLHSLDPKPTFPTLKHV